LHIWSKVGQGQQFFLSGIIMGGHEAKPHSHPYMAWIQIMDEEMPSRCGGVLVQEDFVLTAAHCWGSSVKVTLGAHNIKKQERTQQVISVIETIPHPHYNPKKFSNDIMLLKLERKAMQTAAVRPLSLPRGQAYVRPGEVCHLAGWGQVNPRGRLSDTLQEVELTVQQDQVCHARRPSLRGHLGCRWAGVGSTDSILPTLGPQGDSGGPLVCKNVIQGIVSYGRISRTSPRAFTKVSSFLPWLNKMMKSL
uniref:Peptidase S1 domain-containing protein n=1 Tax=Equus asinus TaxID=9793 RepID=A0A8C4LYN6_EQUAS